MTSILNNQPKTVQTAVTVFVKARNAQQSYERAGVARVETYATAAIAASVAVTSGDVTATVLGKMLHAEAGKIAVEEKGWDYSSADSMARFVRTGTVLRLPERSADDKGSALPGRQVAALFRKVQDLPKGVTATDRDVVRKGHHLTAADRIVKGARTQIGAVTDLKAYVTAVTARADEATQSADADRAADSSIGEQGAGDGAGDAPVVTHVQPAAPTVESLLRDALTLLSDGGPISAETMALGNALTTFLSTVTVDA